MALTLNGSSGISGVDGSASAPSVVGSDSNTGLSFASDTVLINTGGTQRLRIDSNGNMALGTSTIGNESDHKKLIISGASGTGAGILEFQDVSNNTDGAIFSDDGHLFVVADRDNTTSDSSIRFRVDGSSEKMRIDSERIFLSSNTNATGGGSSGLLVSGSQLQSFRGNQGDFILFKTTSNSIIGTIRNNGNTSTQYNTSGSDRALKKNFESWNENVLNLFKNINPQKFNFIHQNDGADKSKGFVAQDMVGSFPEAYSKGEEDDAKYYFNPSGMVVYLMKAIQELEAKVATLEAA